MTTRLTGRISQAIIDEIECRHPDSAALSREMIAAAYMAAISNIHTGQLREVPRDSIISGVEVLGFTITDHTAAALVDLLTDPRVGLLARVTRVKCDQNGEIIREYEYRPGKCRMFALRGQAIMPAWLLEAGVPLQYIQMVQRPGAAEGPSGDTGTQAITPFTTTISRKTMCEVDIEVSECDGTVMEPEWIECDEIPAEIEENRIFS